MYDLHYNVHVRRALLPDMVMLTLSELTSVYNEKNKALEELQRRLYEGMHICIIRCLKFFSGRNYAEVYTGYIMLIKSNVFRHCLVYIYTSCILLTCVSTVSRIYSGDSDPHSWEKNTIET